MTPHERQRLETLERQMREHRHNGSDAPEVSITNLVDVIETVSVVPATTPRRFVDQIKIYVNGATLRLYWYDAKAGVWHYVTATA